MADGDIDLADSALTRRYNPSKVHATKKGNEGTQEQVDAVKTLIAKGECEQGRPIKRRQKRTHGLYERLSSCYSNQSIVNLNIDISTSTSAVNQSIPKRSSRKTSPSSKKLCIWYSFLNCVLVIMVIVLAIMVHNKKSKVSSTTSPPEYCFHRNLIEGHPYDRTNWTFCNQTFCCFKNLNDTGQILRNMTSVWLKNKIAKDTDRKYVRYDCNDVTSVNNNTDRNTVKLVAQDITAPHSWSGDNVVWNCTSDKNIGPCTDSFSLVEDRGYIEVLNTGLYHVYSQVNLVYNTSGVWPATTNFFHRIISRTNIDNRNKEKILMRNFNSQCATKKETQLFSSYLGSDCLLRQGEKIAVRVYEGPLLEMPPISNFFGIVRL